jgi:hypothetical protein
VILKITFRGHFVETYNEDTLAKIFKKILDQVPIENAVETISKFTVDDAIIYRLVRKELKNRVETDSLFESLLWSSDKILKAKSLSHEFFFYIPLAADEESKLGVSVSIDNSYAHIRYHHLVSNQQHLLASDCIPWESMNTEQEAMYTLLISKIEIIPNDWFVEQARECNRVLLVPYTDLE